MRKPEAMEILTTTIKAIHENKKVGMDDRIWYKNLGIFQFP